MLDQNNNVLATKTADTQARIDQLKADDTNIGTLDGQLSALFVDTTKYGKQADNEYVYSPYNLAVPTKALVEITTTSGEIVSATMNLQ